MVYPGSCVAEFSSLYKFLNLVRVCMHCSLMCFSASHVDEMKILLILGEVLRHFHVLESAHVQDEWIIVLSCGFLVKSLLLESKYVVLKQGLACISI